MDRFDVGDRLNEVQRNGVNYTFASIPCYAYCSTCGKSIIRDALIRKNVFIGFSRKIKIETWDKINKQYIVEDIIEPS